MLNWNFRFSTLKELEKKESSIKKLLDKYTKDREGVDYFIEKGYDGFSYFMNIHLKKEKRNQLIKEDKFSIQLG